MTVSTEISSNEYTGNGVTTDFDYKFRIFKANQLSVITSDADGDNVVTLRLGTDYIVTGANKSAGGKVILTKPLANGHKISIARDIPITQETSFRNQSKFFAETHEDAFDYLTMIIQRIWGSLGSLYLKRPNILANWFDAKGYRIANLGKPKRDIDAVDLGTLKDEISGVNSAILKREKRLLRVDDMDIAALPKASDRAGNVLTFDKDGKPIVVAPASGSAVDVLNQLNKPEGAGIIGTESGKSVQETLNYITIEHEAVMALFPCSLMSFSRKRIAIEVIESDPLLGVGEINTYRQTKSGWWVRERIITGQYSGGDSLPDNNCPVWRLGQLFICTHLLTLKSKLSGSSGSVSTYEFTPDQFKLGDNKNKVKFHQLQGSSGGYVEFETNTKNKDIGILYASTPTTENPLVVSIYAGDVLLQETEIVATAGVGDTFETVLTYVNNPRPSSLIKIRIHNKSERYCYVAGINAEFDKDISDDIDSIYWSIFNTTSGKVIRPTQTGAMCYVFREESTGLFGGESHGGEVPSLQQFIVDNRERVLKSGEMFSCESFRVVQETQIKWNDTAKINCFTEHRFNSDGTHEFTGSFIPSPNFKASLAYCPMFTVDYDYFKKIKTPEFYNLASYPEGSFIEFNYPINSFEMQSSDNLYTTGIAWSASLKNTDVSNVLIKPYADRSTKLYAGPSTGKVINLQKFTIHQMRYHF
ncbi:hypothetical protein [Providencia rettgeri]|uniref:Phage tail protein n=1 Tax=Providencia rettgeri TaxID=587 RepID=A0A9N8GW62_PRORE|nr:hypothetical protein [Providencia rettgeri]CAB5642857.1 Uncharacterised protein [Providencia rettgeri]CAB5679271.1 Uncharacterised protein [Providencia rettgeri]CAC9243661.1 Uncharacterised protein [Providencia rettgeri]CAC9247580.1 Uncharacterised protein [Providencia rettgeri]